MRASAATQDGQAPHASNSPSAVSTQSRHFASFAANSRFPDPRRPGEQQAARQPPPGQRAAEPVHLRPVPAEVVPN